MLMTRIGQNSRIVITGDVEQADRRGSNNGLLDLVQRISQQPVDGIDLCQMSMKDVQRHPLIGSILRLYQPVPD